MRKIVFRLLLHGSWYGPCIGIKTKGLRRNIAIKFRIPACLADLIVKLVKLDDMLTVSIVKKLNKLEKGLREYNNR